MTPAPSPAAAWPPHVVAPGGGHPADPATASTPAAAGAHDVAALAGDAGDLARLDARVSVCRACPRLVAHREEVARVRRRAYADEAYWGRPVPGFGDAAPAVLVVGLAPGAHGANRTGRVFTGDDSGRWLYRALHRAGLASAPDSRDAGDGLVLPGTRITCPVRCAPPDNRPTAGEVAACRPWLEAELRLVAPGVAVVLALGGLAWSQVLAVAPALGAAAPRPRPRFAHGAEVALTGGPVLLGSYHVSRQNTSTGRLTEEMLDDVVGRAAHLAGSGGEAAGGRRQGWDPP